MEIVENRRGRLSRPFLSPGDNFSKSYDENQIWSERHSQNQQGQKSAKIPCLTPAIQLPYSCMYPVSAINLVLSIAKVSRGGLSGLAKQTRDLLKAILTRCFSELKGLGT